MKKSYEEKSKNIRRSLDDLTPKDRKNVRAIALNYEFGKKKAPRIVATGRGKIAESILQLAEENQVPLYEDESLTELLSKLDLDTEIPPQLFALVAEVLAVVYQMNKLSKSKGK
jgi:flagellar biosynthesis protein